MTIYWNIILGVDLYFIRAFQTNANSLWLLRIHETLNSIKTLVKNKLNVDNIFMVFEIYKSATNPSTNIPVDIRMILNVYLPWNDTSNAIFYTWSNFFMNKIQILVTVSVSSTCWMIFSWAQNFAGLWKFWKSVRVWLRNPSWRLAVENYRRIAFRFNVWIWEGSLMSFENIEEFTISYPSCCCKNLHWARKICLQCFVSSSFDYILSSSTFLGSWTAEDRQCRVPTEIKFY